MTKEIITHAKTVLSASRKRLFWQKPVFKSHTKVSPNELAALERKIGVLIPNDLRDWLLVVGYGDIDEEISFREEWFAAIESGPLKGGARFAQDILGNFYAFDSCGQIYYLSRSEPVFATIAESFFEFVLGFPLYPLRILVCSFSVSSTISSGGSHCGSFICPI